MTSPIAFAGWCVEQVKSQDMSDPAFLSEAQPTTIEDLNTVPSVRDDLCESYEEFEVRHIKWCPAYSCIQHFISYCLSSLDLGTREVQCSVCSTNAFYLI